MILFNRYKSFQNIKKDIEQYEGGLDSFSKGYENFGITRTPTGQRYREWAPGAHGVFLIGDFSKCNISQL